MQLENDDLRQRVVYLESVTGKDSQMIRDNVVTSSKVDWAQYLLNVESTQDDMKILAESKDKIAHEILRLRAENQKLSQLASCNGKTMQRGGENLVSRTPIP